METTANNNSIAILNEDLFEFTPDVMEYLDSVETTEYLVDWCKEILPDSDEF